MSRGHLAMSGKLLVVTVWGFGGGRCWCDWHLMGRARNLIKYPTIQAPQQRIFFLKISVRAEVEKLCCNPTTPRKVINLNHHHNNNNEHLLNTYYIPDTVLNNSHIYSHGTSTAIPMRKVLFLYLWENWSLKRCKNFCKITLQKVYKVYKSFVRWSLTKW